ncbi:F-box protein At3g07870-like [Camellia sinensis]|uniref:F-box protein At3g07870-like n=1 Tax=Camellia sinensis TaxID=4442 RepID=UPI0010359335|nr:F-box protein At3g07870-like [Camellia sinensis]
MASRRGRKSRTLNTRKGDKEVYEFEDEQNQKLDPEFVKLHFAQGEAYPLVKSLAPTRVSRTLYLVEPPETNTGFDLGYCDCYGYLKWDCDRHLNMKLDTKLKIPLHNAKLVINSEGTDANMNNLRCKSGVKRKRCIKLIPKDRKLNVVNSCNGLLCLSEPLQNYPVVVCNPITDEFIIPTQTAKHPSAKKFSDCGLGFSPKTKVIRMFDQQECQLTREPISGRGIYSSRIAEIHTLDYIISFDFDNDEFKSFPPPPHERSNVCHSEKPNMSIGALRGQLCVCDSSYFEYIELWVMEKYGVQGSWTKQFSISTMTDHWRWLRGLYEPMSYLRNGAILFFHRMSNAVYYYDPKKWELIFLKLSGIKSRFEAIAHIPSFISLKDIVMGDNLAVLNIKSR